MKLLLVACAVLVLWLLPAPLLPPHRLADLIASTLGLSWKISYFVAMTGLQVAVYGCLGIWAAFAVEKAPSSRSLLMQLVALPAFVVVLATVIRWAKTGHLPAWPLAAIPVVSCWSAVAIGIGLRNYRWKSTLITVITIAAAALWWLNLEVSSELQALTEQCLQRIVHAWPAATLPDARFAQIVEAAFQQPMSGGSSREQIEQNRAAILALGIAMGDERLAPLVGVETDDGLFQLAKSLRPKTHLRGRGDWARHFSLSAAFAVLESPWLSDAGGILKEELDSLKGGSGFSFSDYLADRAGIRFATTATRSGNSAEATRARLRNGFEVDDFFPPAADLRENLSLDEFRKIYGRIGSQKYRDEIQALEGRLDQCAGLKYP